MTKATVRHISSILLILGGALFLSSLGLPVYRDEYNRSGDLDYGFAWGVMRGYEIWALSIMFSLTGWLFIFLGLPAILAFSQLYYAVRFHIARPGRLIMWVFIITSIATPIFIFCYGKPSQQQIGYYLWQAGYWISTIGIIARRQVQGGEE